MCAMGCKYRVYAVDTFVFFFVVRGNWNWNQTLVPIGISVLILSFSSNSELLLWICLIARFPISPGYCGSQLSQNSPVVFYSSGILVNLDLLVAATDLMDQLIRALERLSLASQSFEVLTFNGVGKMELVIEQLCDMANANS